jgi:hypothetical protein
VTPAFHFRAGALEKLAWSRRGSCGEPGCKDPECCCAVCRLPVGVSEDDPRWDNHSEDCGECELCRDQVPTMLFRGEGKACEQALFHQACFESCMEFETAPSLRIQ